MLPVKLSNNIRSLFLSTYSFVHTEKISDPKDSDPEIIRGTLLCQSVDYLFTFNS